MKIFLDDMRYPRGEGNTDMYIVRNYADFFWVWEMNKHNITEISFDHDLGGEKRSGYDALVLVEEDYVTGKISHPIVLNVHSANPVGAEKMVKVIKSLEKYMLEGLK
jgi:hypothetical protein